MKKQGFYSAGELMKLAHITKKTIRYYDEHNILKPSYIDPATRTRFYTDDDVAHLQQILLLKMLGFSLNDIKEMTVNSSDPHLISDSLNLQLHLLEDRIEQMQVVAQTISESSKKVGPGKMPDWKQMINQIHDVTIETRLKNQYLNASNISARINLHSIFSQNKYGWFPWIFDQCRFHPGMSILELGCGDGSFWAENIDKVPENINAIISDASEGMLRDTRCKLLNFQKNFTYKVINCESIPYEDDSFDIIIANHLMFYCNDIFKACSEIRRVLKPEGMFICSTYGSRHMIEVSELVSSFDDRIILSAEKLYERFGKENGKSILSSSFEDIRWEQYEDSLVIPTPEPLISYILSCHGNQNRYILDKYNEFRTYVRARTGKGFHITKDAGVFICGGEKNILRNN